ncbi:type II toxin-antitoxin system RelE/ParE family toxin [Epilithonimonas vandammei]|uniref:type II toxin-antitoxin system RelE/ParE family toxin n=1 Tax=Epilithonimonas vandammei TaxID=2487072 RepID=UPI0028B1A884|nr:hypothetical protein [Epilithonimonas vandammei]
MKIKFSDESLSDLRNIEEYLLEHWSDKILDDFLTKLDEIVEIICDGKVVFSKIRGYNLSQNFNHEAQYTYLYHRKQHFKNRQNPPKLPRSKR